MSCATMHERMMDVLYGEELNPDRCLEFFRHLESCPDCKAEYLELVETRSLLAQWDLGQAVPEVRAATLPSDPFSRPERRPRSLVPLTQLPRTLPVA